MRRPTKIDEQATRPDAGTFERFLRRHDANTDGNVTRAEFKGAPQMFKRFDRDGDEDVDINDFAAFEACATGPEVAWSDPSPDGRYRIVVWRVPVRP